MSCPFFGGFAKRHDPKRFGGMKMMDVCIQFFLMMFSTLLE